MDLDLKEYDESGLIELYSSVIGEFYDREIIRTGNVTGDIGEHIACKYYEEKFKENLALKPPSYKETDATSNVDGKEIRYAIKTIRKNRRTTGTFFGVSESTKEPIFDKLIIVELDEIFRLERIVEMDWNTFFANKRYNKRMKAYFIYLSRELEEKFQKEA